MDVDDENHPCFAIVWNDDVILHACLGVDGAPVAQEGSRDCDVSTSLIAQEEETPRWMLFHHLKIEGYGAIVEALLSNAILAWSVHLDATTLSAGIFSMVTKKEENNANEVMKQRLGPFR